MRRRIAYPAAAVAVAVAGSALAAGAFARAKAPERAPVAGSADDVNGDGHADLAAGAAGENAASGSVTILRGTASGLTTSGAKAYGPGTFGYPATGARFGDALSG